MADLAVIQERIDAIDALIAKGVKSAASSDRRCDYDLDSARKERERLMRIIAMNKSSQYRRVVFKNA